MTTFAGIIRSTEFSPNSNDLAIMRKVAEKLENRSAMVFLETEAEFAVDAKMADAYFSMGREEKTLEKLAAIEQKGITVVNSTAGVRNCARPVITDLMQRNGIPVPQSFIWDFSRTGSLQNDVIYPCWVKRGDSCAKQKEDVCFVRNEKELQQTIADFKRRGIFVAVYNRHLVGDVIKFYGVAATDFFYWYYPTLGAECHGKFGLEKINGPAHRFLFDVQALKRDADRVAVISGTPVYGGDCIVDSEGNYRIIDFNDWPSFSCCLDAAADAISNYLLSQIKQDGNYQR